MNGSAPPGRHRHRRWSVAATLAVAVLTSGCSTGVATLSFPNPPAVTSTAPPVSTATFPTGLAATTENPVDGVTTTTVPTVGPGPATLTGTVLGPAGPVGGAVVEADRLVGSAAAVARTTSAADGSWSLPDILGGRYRVRAWESPNLDLTDPQTIFLAADQPQSLTLQLTAYRKTKVSVAVNPPDPVAGQPANLVVQVLEPSVDSSGVLRYVPVSGSPVSLVDGPSWQIDTPGPVPTDRSGEALFSVTCTSPGDAPLSAQVGTGTAVALQVPQCAAPAPTLPPVTGPPGTGPASTATTCPPSIPSPTGNDQSTTTTSLLYGNC